jgi:hypothetical protein
MSDTIRIKRRSGGAPGAPASLSNAELAYNEVDHTLYIGEGTGGAGGSASTIRAIGGDGLAVTLPPGPTGPQGPPGATGPAGPGIPTGGTTGQVLTKTSATDYATNWQTPTAGGGGNVSNSGTPTNGQLAQFTDATHIQGINGSALGFESTANKGAANGYASLDATAKVPAAQLPSYVDDVVEYANLAAFPATGAAGIIYVAIDTGKIYRWSGSAYVEISPSPGSTDAVPEGSINLYYTDARVAANPTVAGKADASALAAYAPLASPVFTGDARAVTPATSDNDTSIATTQFVKAQGYATTAALAGYQPLDGDLTSLAAASSVAIYYRSAADTWAAVTIGSGLSFTSGTLDAPVFTSSAKGEVPASGGGTANFLRADGTWAAPAGGGGGIPEPVGDGFYGRNMASGTGSWVAAVKKAGDTMTGALTVLPGAGAEGITLSSAAGQARLVAAGSAADVGLFVTGKGVASHYFYTNSFANVQLSIVHQTAAGAVMIAGGDGSATPYNIYMNTGGNVKTQTPAIASNDTSIATTAWARNMLAARSCFQAVLPSNQVGFTATTWSPCNFATANFNTGSNYNTGTLAWTPPAGKVQINVGLYFSNITANTDSYIAIYKNGGIFRQGKFYTNTALLGMNISCIDNASGSDAYQVYCFLGGVGGGGGGTLNAGALTFFDGSQI